MKKFFYNIITSNTKESSKRFISLVLLVNILAMAWVSMFKGFEIPSYIFDGLLFLCGAGMGFTSIERIFSKGQTTPTEPPVEQQPENNKQND